MVILDNLLLQVSPPFLFCETGALFRDLSGMMTVKYLAYGRTRLLDKSILP